jgi:hypothetical protein
MNHNFAAIFSAIVSVGVGSYCGYILGSKILRNIETKGERFFLLIAVISISVGISGLINEFLGSYLGVFTVNENNLYKFIIANIILFPLVLTTISLVWRLIFGQHKISNKNFNNEIDQDFYKTAYQELHSDERDIGLWAESLSVSSGDRAKAEAYYLKHRAFKLNEKKKIVGSYKENSSSRSIAEVIDDNFIPFIFWGAILGAVIFLFNVATKVSQKIENENVVNSVDPIQKYVNTANQNLEGTQKFSECEHISDGEIIKFNTDGKVEMSAVRKFANYEFIDSTTLDKVTDNFQDCGVMHVDTIYCIKDDASDASIKHEISVDVLQKMMTVKKLKMKDYGFDTASTTKCSLN